MRRLIPLSINRPSDRRGVSLVEVLMSLGLMSIGIAFIAGIFPLAALRTLRATNLTNATILRYNAEAAIATTTDSFGTRVLIHDPDRNGNLDQHRGRNYIVDPLGFQEAAAVGQSADVFGRNPPGSVTTGVPSRFAAGFQDIPSARNFVTLPDTFTDIGEAVAVASSPTSATLPTDIDLSTVTPPIASNPASPVYRALIFNTAQDRSESRIITGIAAAPAGWTITWAGALPFGDVGLVQVEVPTTRYTWMLSVRKRSSGPANVDVVIFLNRSFSAESEQVYEAEFRRFSLDPSSAFGDGKPGAENHDDDGNGTQDDRREIGFPGTDDLPNNRVILRWPDDDNSDNDPFLQRGAFILDTKNCLWYRMMSVESQTSDGTTITARVLLDTAIRSNNTDDVYNFGTDDNDEDVNGDGSRNQGGAITPRGVIEVYPLGLQ